MSNAILQIVPLGFPWATLDPFLFCVHHNDAYPRGDDAMAPATSLAGRNLGMDFEGKDGWSMYHGRQVPGFPRHPHRGFETITVVRRGFIDHADSLGATARFGAGDVQWMTAGAGIEHCEMFPLRERDKDNPLELFQIWLNLPAKSKMVTPYFSMLWNERIPRIQVNEGSGVVDVKVVAGALGDASPLAPPPDSWASDPASDIAVWTMTFSPSSSMTLPPAPPTANRMLYVFEGDAVVVDGVAVAAGHGVHLSPEAPVVVQSGKDGADMLLLQGSPIGEPVVQHGPFVMNTKAEILQAMHDYQRDTFGLKWPWGKDDPVHRREEGRFALHPDGKKDVPT